MKIGNIDIDPAKNPAVLDTCTWDVDAVVGSSKTLSREYLAALASSIKERTPMPASDGFVPQEASLTRKDDASVFIVSCADGQDVLAEVLRPGSESALGTPFADLSVDGNERLVLHKTDAAVLDTFFRQIDPLKGPTALGSTPRLGIGVRMTTACWPAILRAMEQEGFAANSIQNSVRELNFLSTVLEGDRPETNYACGFGTIETGYTGSTFEGLWVAGVLAALKYPATLPYGADADHVQVKRGVEGMAKAKRYIDSCRYYSFFTLDMADILDYGALAERSSAAAADLAAAKLPDSGLRHDVLAYHKEPCRIDGRMYVLEDGTIHRLIGKYWEAMAALDELTAYIESLKKGQTYDLELTIDEHPPEIAAFDCLTTEEEAIFVLNEIKRRGLRVSHLAPNVGVEKGFDYRGSDGLDGLERRIRPLFHIANAFDVMLDFHSGDDLTAAPRQVIRNATDGKHHFKVSPMLQLLYAEVLEAFHPELFREWWEDALSYATREAKQGSTFAKECVQEYENASDKTPSRRNLVFHHYSFAFVGKRDDAGRFVNRGMFYDLSPAFYREYENRLVQYLKGLAEDLF